MKSFVDLCKTFKWCPGNGCQLVCENETGQSIEVECDCGEKYCFGCDRGAHLPIDCDLLDKWIEKITKYQPEEAKSDNWVRTNAKKCPKCRAPI